MLSYDSLKSSGFWKRILHPSNTKLIPLKHRNAGKFITKCYFITLTHTHNGHVGECFNLKPWKSITPPIFVLIVLHNSCVINNIFVSKLLFNTIIDWIEVNKVFIIVSHWKFMDTCAVILTHVYSCTYFCWLESRSRCRLVVSVWRWNKSMVPLAILSSRTLVS